MAHVVVTHAHFDHIGGLADLPDQAPATTVRAGRPEVPAVQAAPGGRPVQPLDPGAGVAGFTVRMTPGHTPGHLCLLREDDGVLLAGDVVGSDRGALTQAPAMFTDDPVTAQASLRKSAALEVARLITSHGDELVDGPAQLAILATA